MRDIRKDSGEKAPEPSWKKAGWSRPPKNGREWRSMREGKPEPEEKKPYRCRRCKGTAYKTLYIKGRETRTCVACRSRTRKAYYERTKGTKLNEYRRDYYNRKKEEELVWVPGQGSGSGPPVLTVNATWIHMHIKKIPELVQKGNIVVEVFGVPEYLITRIA